MDLTETKVCKKCKEEQNIECFAPYYGEGRKKGIRRNVCRKCHNKRQVNCIKNNPDRKESLKSYLRDYYRINNHVLKVKAYRNFDRKKGLPSITLDEFRNLLANNPYCFYCNEGHAPMLGLDRKDNEGGHNLENVVICCEKCNYILSDIPFEAKLLLKPGFIKIKEQNLLDKWIIKTKRKLKPC